MQFVKTDISGAFLLQPQYHKDERGAFARSFCQKEFKDRGLVSNFVQTSVSLNTSASTLRGMHLQTAPFAETKIVRVTQGAIFDVILDLRPESETFLAWQGFQLTAENRHSLYIPAGVAHGFQTLTDNAEVFYMMDEFYYPDCASGVRWNDPAFNIQWPETTSRIISEKDQQWPLFQSVQLAQQEAPCG